MKICPYCKTESTPITPECLDYCGECELIIEGIEVDENELNHLAEQQNDWWVQIDQDEEAIEDFCRG